MRPITQRAVITIRRMKHADLEQVALLDNMSFAAPWSLRAFSVELHQNPNAYMWVAATTIGENQPPVIFEPRRRISILSSRLQVGTGQMAILGMLVIWLVIDEAHIATLSVHPQFRRQGIASRLLVTGLKEIILNGATSATLEVRESNQAAQKLYQQFGFAVVGQRPKYYVDNREDAILMTVSELGPSYIQWLESKKTGAKP